MLYIPTGHTWALLEVLVVVCKLGAFAMIFIACLSKGGFSLSR